MISSSLPSSNPPLRLLLLLLLLPLLQSMTTSTALLVSAAGMTAYEFRERPVNTSVQVGGEVLLRCAAATTSTSSDASSIQSQWRANTGALLSFHDAGVLPGYGGRYSYVRESSEELHLRIENITLADNGLFECQMLRPPNKFMRAAAYVNVLLAPKELLFLLPADSTEGDPQTRSASLSSTSSVLELDEERSVNITCYTNRAKPEPELSVYLNGKRIVADPPLQRWSKYHADGTVSAYASLTWLPTKLDHNKLLACEASHPETGVNLRNTLGLQVYYSSERPRISLITADGNSDGTKVISGDELEAGQEDVAEGRRKKKAVNLKAGDNVTLVCTAEGGNPPPRLWWTNSAGQIINDTSPNTKKGKNYEYDEVQLLTRTSLPLTLRGDDNDATYECLSQNRPNATLLRRSVTLHVHYPPYSVYLYGSTAVRKGDAIVVTCASAPASPAANITWLVDGKPTRLQAQSEKRQARGIVTESNITIDSAAMLLSGQHQIQVECVAQNDQGPPASNLHIIRVLSPPSQPVIFEPADGNFALLEGSQINLTCEAQGGHPLPTLSWYRGIEKIKETSSSNNGDVSLSTATIHLDRSMNQQHIRCEAENGALEVPLVATKKLTVLFPPNHVKIRPIDRDPQPMVAEQMNKLVCSVPSSNPPAELTWEFEGRVVGNDPALAVRPGQFIRRGGTHPTGEYRGHEVENVLAFTPTVEMDKSQLRCLASHPQWKDVRVGTYTLDVLYAPRFAAGAQTPLSIVVGEGEHFEENLTIHANPPVSVYHWRKNGVAFERAVGAVHARGPVLTGTEVTKEDSGIYTLRVANRIGPANATLRLTVEYPARVTYITSPVIAGVGEDVVLECEGDGLPLRPQMVRWMRDGVELRSIVQDQRRAVLRLNASHDSAGPYTCVADNGVVGRNGGGGPNYTTAYLLVRRAPVVVRSPALDRAAGPIGGRAHLRCRASAVPNVEFSWGLEEGGVTDGRTFIQRESIPAQHGGSAMLTLINYNTSKYRFHDTQLDHTTFESILTVMDLEERDYSRRYRCRASNRLGVVQTFVALGPPTAPDTPLELRVTNMTDTTATLAWQPGFDGGAEQLFELRYQAAGEREPRSANSSGEQIVLTDLRVEHAYRVQIRAINMRGRLSEFSTPALKFYTLDENLQGGGGFGLAGIRDGFPGDGVLSNPLYMGAIALFAILLLAHLLLLCKFKRRQMRRRKMQEKAELARGITTHSSPNSSGRPIQIYGTMNPHQHHHGSQRNHHSSFTAGGRQALLVNSPGLNKRSESSATNRSTDLANEAGFDSAGNGGGVSGDDSGSVRTMIEVNQNGYVIGPVPPPEAYTNGGENGAFYEAHCLADYDAGLLNDLYSPIQKGAPANPGHLYSHAPHHAPHQTYAPMPYPEPPAMSSLAADEKFPSLDQCPSPHLHRAAHFMINGGNVNGYASHTLPPDFGGGYGPIDNGDWEMPSSRHQPAKGSGSLVDYVTTTSATSVAGMRSPYGSLRRGSGGGLAHQSTTTNGYHPGTPKIMSTFAQQPAGFAVGNGNGGLKHQRIQHQLQNGYNVEDSVLVEGDLV